MSEEAVGQGDDVSRETLKSRPVRADAQRNLDALLADALAVFATSGVDAPVREIAERAVAQRDRRSLFRLDNK